jgi:hypothetical protein
MLFTIIGVAAIMVQTICYWLVSRRSESWLNFATLPLLSNICLNGVLEVLSLDTIGPSGSLYAYTYIMATYTAIAIAYVVGMHVQPPNLKILQPLRTQEHWSPIIPWGSLLLGFLIYLPVLITYRAYLLEPRIIYANTSTGYGLQFFISSMFTTVAWSSFLFVKRNFRTTIIFFILCAVMLYLHGSKGQLITLFIINLLYGTYALNRRVSLGRFLPMLGLGVILFAGIFLLLTNIDFTDTLRTMENFSDYTRNGMLVIDEPLVSKAPYYGRLTIEDEAYSRLPRVLYPEKPKDFGQVRLAELFFPDWFDQITGTPAFGVGVAYADFGAFAILFIFVFNVWTTWITIGVIRRFQETPNPGLFILLLFFSGIALIPLGVGFLLPESFVLAYLINLSFRLVNAFWHGRRAEQYDLRSI